MESEIQGKLFKIGTAWGAVGITSWADAASAIAFLYTFVLLCEWLWKKLVKPALMSRGYIKAERRRKGDSDD